MLSWERNLQFIFEVSSSNTDILIVYFFLLNLLYLFVFLLFNLLNLISKMLHFFQMLVYLFRKLIVKILIDRRFFITERRFECFMAPHWYLIFSTLLLCLRHLHMLLHGFLFWLFGLIFQDIGNSYSAEIRLIFKHSFADVLLKFIIFDS